MGDEMGCRSMKTLLLMLGGAVASFMLITLLAILLLWCFEVWDNIIDDFKELSDRWRN
jgi:hypothetical protein